MRVSPAPVVSGQVVYPFPAEFAGQQPGLHWTVGDHADVVGGAVGQQFFFNLALQHTVGWLQRGNRVNRLDPLQLGQAKVGNATVP